MKPPSETPSGIVARPSLTALFLAFARISLISFGGGISALVFHEVVFSRRWISEKDFLTGMAIAQAMPGVNVTNLAVWVGYHLRGTPGAVVAITGALLPAGLLVIGLGAVLTRAAETGPGALALAGVAAAALGLSANMGLRTARFALRNLSSIAVFAITYAGALLAPSSVLVVCVLAPASILLAFWQTPDE